MSLLINSDYIELERMNIKFDEIEEKRFLIFKDIELPKGIYSSEKCEILVIIPPSYPSHGNDMFWTYPRLTRLDGKIIPGTISLDKPEAQRDVRCVENKVFERWSRHWNKGNQVWRAGRDDIVSVVNRLNYVLSHSIEG